MSDCYEWIDPFAEKQRADRVTAQLPHAREEGRRDVLRVIAERHEGDFAKALGRAVSYLAEKVANEDLKVHLARDFREFEVRKAMAEKSASLMLDFLRPAQTMIVQNGELRVDMPPDFRGLDELIVSYEPKPPPLRSHSVRLTASAWT